MPKVTEAHVEARRLQILDAAASSFAAKGFHHTTMHDICQIAELSPGAVYRYYKSKEEIIEAMIRERRSTSAALIEAISRRLATLDILSALADTFFGELENPQACALNIELWAESLRSPRIRNLLMEELSLVREQFVQIIERAQERGEINPVLDPLAVARVMISFFEGLVLQQAADNSVDVWKYVDAMKAMMSGVFWMGKRQKEGVE